MLYLLMVPELMTIDVSKYMGRYKHHLLTTSALTDVSKQVMKFRIAKQYEPVYLPVIHLNGNTKCVTIWLVVFAQLLCLREMPSFTAYPHSQRSLTQEEFLNSVGEKSSFHPRQQNTVPIICILFILG